MQAPIWLDVFLQPIRDNQVAQVALAAMLLLTLADVLFGLLHALISHTFSSSKMREGIGHKCVSLGFVFVADVVDGALLGGMDLPFATPVLVTACTYLCIMEISSLLEQFVAIEPQLVDSPVFKLLNVSHEEDKDGLE